MENMIINILVGVGIPAIVAIIAKIYPKQKIIDSVYPVFYNMGVLLDKIGNIRLGERVWNSVEEGVFRTIIEVIKDGILCGFWDGMKNTKKHIETSTEAQETKTDPDPNVNDSGEDPNKQNGIEQ